MRIRIETSLMHGILFLYDPYGDPEFPKDTGASEITFTDSCICFQVPSYVDGETDVTISDNGLFDSAPVFSSRIITPKKYIALADSFSNYYAIIKLKYNFTNINIWNSEYSDQESSWIQIVDVDIF